MKITKAKKKIIIVVVAIILIIAGSLIFKPKKSPYEFARVERKDIQQIVSASGTVKPRQEINLQFETTGKVRNIFVKVGDQVKAGQILIKIDDSDLQAQYRQQLAAVEAAKAQLDLLKAGSSPEEIKLAENAVTNAQKNLNDVKEKADHDLNVLYNNSIEVLNDAYLKTDSMCYRYVADLFTSQNKLSFSTTHTQAQIQAENYYSLVKDNLIRMAGEINEIKILYTPALIEQSLENFKKYLETNRNFLDITSEALNNSVGLASTTLATYKSNLEITRTNINTAISNVLIKQQAIASQKIANQMNINIAQSNLDQATYQLDIKKAGAREEDLRYREALIKQQEASLASVADRIRKTNLTAPINGVITSINSEIGETVNLGQISVSMNSVGNFEIELDISETDIPKVSIGQSATITLDAFPDEKFSGHVVEIEPAQTIIQGVVYYKATISFDNQDERIKAGMTANVDIITAERKNVLTIPLRSVTKKNGSGTIKVLENNQIKEIEIQVGLISSSEIEVISGLAEGQQIISFIKQK